MSLWDGLITDTNCQVIVMGATNRPQDVDRAILRRMPSMFHIGLPVSTSGCFGFNFLRSILTTIVVFSVCTTEEVHSTTNFRK